MRADAAAHSARKSRASVWVPAVYLAAVAVALALPFMVGAPEAGIWAMLLTMPWPLLAVPLIDAIDPALMDAGFGIVTAGVGAVINAFLLHILLRRREAGRGGTSSIHPTDEGQVRP